MPLSPGDLLANKYRIEAEIGRGAFGRVYRARDLALDRVVAIKELHKGEDDLSSTQFADYARRFEREARVQAAFNHPNIVHVYELLKGNDEQRYLVMEYVDGESLRDYLARRDPLPVGEAIRITGDILAGLAAVHTDPRDIVHRDIKPSNVLLAKDGRAKLTDFGLAQVGDESRRSEDGKPHPGTALYMSPEQETTNAYLYPTSDLFSVGCVLFELLSGVPYKQAKKDRKGLTDLRPNVPSPLSEIVAAALAREPDKRPKDGAEMGRLLAEANTKIEATAKAPQNTREKGAPAPPSQPATKAVARPAVRPGRRLPVAAIAGAVILIGLLAVAAAILPTMLKGSPTPGAALTPSTKTAQVGTAASAASQLIARTTPATTAVPTQDLTATRTSATAAALAATRAVAATLTVLPTFTATPSMTPSPSPTSSPTLTPSRTPAPTATRTWTPTATPSATATRKASPTTARVAVPARANASAMPANAKRLGESYDGATVSLTLKAYTINSDGGISLRFGVMNRSGEKVMLRYQNRYFSVEDDAGKRYPQDETNLLDQKQQELAGGASYEIGSDSWPGPPSEIGWFTGMVPQGVHYLLVKVSQFADLTDLVWTIPLDPQETSEQMPAAGTQQPVQEGFSANGISMRLLSYSIASDGGIGLRFRVVNTGNADVLLRYQNRYWSVVDDLGTVYQQDQTNLLDPKQILLTPGAAYEIATDSWPGPPSEIGYFSGMIPEEASALLVNISQFADLRDLWWRIPLNAQLVREQAPGPGTELPVQEGFSANGIGITLLNYSIASDGGIGLRFRVANDGNSDVLLRYRNRYWEVTDDLGNRYPQDQTNLLDSKQVLLKPASGYEIATDSWPGPPTEIGYFSGMIPEGASALLVNMSRFADLRDLRWRIPLNAQLVREQQPAPGTQQQPEKGFSANGISITLLSHSIDPSGSIGLRFRVANDGNNSVLLRYRNRYWEVTDDLSTRYRQDETNLLDPKQILLAPSASYEIVTDSWPGPVSEIGYFTGKVPESARALIIKISQFGPLRDLQWLIPLK